VLGAFVIDVPAGPFLANSRAQNIVLAVGVFFVLGIIGLYISILHYRQLSSNAR